jgi:manganese transport protein
VVSQVVLSFALPFPMVALILFTSRRDIMGEFVNSRVTRNVAIGATVVILALNAFLLLQTFGVTIPGLPAS